MSTKQELMDGLTRSQERSAQRFREQFRKEQEARIKAEQEKKSTEDKTKK